MVGEIEGLHAEAETVALCPPKVFLHRCVQTHDTRPGQCVPPQVAKEASNGKAEGKGIEPTIDAAKNH
jgi:hypothetical protein